MTWALVASVNRLVRSAFATPASTPANQSADTSGPAQYTAPKSSPCAIDLGRRAERVCNRQRDRVERYLAVHLTLGRGR